ncbi:MAG TPA: cupin domain-containing protein [Bacteroidales bacterium]|nr:cupin domain-containing protein [Bacteroidales bacterium]
MPVNKKDDPVTEKISPTFERRIASLNKLMVVVCDFTGGPALNPDPPHFHPHEQITYVAEGELKFFKGDKEFHLNKGDLITIQAGVPHCIQTLSEHVKLIDSFHPVREDFLP